MVELGVPPWLESPVGPGGGPMMAGPSAMSLREAAYEAVDRHGGSPAMGVVMVGLWLGWWE